MEKRHGGPPFVLICRRRDDKVLGGFWELPGGKIEPGETPAQCLMREFAEELGVVVGVGKALPPIEHRYDHGLVRLHPFYCTRVTHEPQNREVAEHRWVGPEDLAALRFPPANAALMVQIARTLHKAPDGARDEARVDARGTAPDAAGDLVKPDRDETQTYTKRIAAGMTGPPPGCGVDEPDLPVVDEPRETFPHD